MKEILDGPPPVIEAFAPVVRRDVEWLVNHIEERARVNKAEGAVFNQGMGTAFGLVAEWMRSDLLK